MRWNDRIGRRIKLSDLHVLLAVAQNGSMAKAASQLAVSLPVVSRAISDLEHTLGARLVERKPRGVELTSHGRAMLSRSYTVFDELRQGVSDIESLSDPSVGEVRIGTTPPLAASFVSAVIERLNRRYPRIVFQVTTDMAQAQKQNLRERKVDLLIYRQIDPFKGEEMSFQFLFESPYVVAAGVESPWVKRRRINLIDLLGEQWALPPPDDSFGPFVASAFRAGGFDLPRAAVVASTIELCASLLRTGRYLTIVPEFWLQFPERHQFIRKLAVDLPVTGAPIGIIGLRSRVPSPVVQRFIDCAREVAQPRNRDK